MLVVFAENAGGIGSIESQRKVNTGKDGRNFKNNMKHLLKNKWLWFTVVLLSIIKPMVR